MTPTDKKLIAALLGLISEFNIRPVNVFYLAKLVPDPEERRSIVRAYYDSIGAPEQFDSNNDYSWAIPQVLIYIAEQALQEDL